MRETGKFHYHPLFGPTSHYFTHSARMPGAAGERDVVPHKNIAYQSVSELAENTQADVAARTRAVPTEMPDGRQAAINALLAKVDRLAAQPTTLSRLAEAAGACEQIIRHDADHYVAWSSLGDILFQLGQKSRCKEIYARLIELRPEGYEPYFGRATIAWDEADWSTAKVFFAEGVTKLVADVGTENAPRHIFFLAGKLALKGLGEPVADVIWRDVLRFLRDEVDDIAAIISFIHMVGMKTSSPHAWRSALLALLSAPLIQARLGKLDYLGALRLASEGFQVALFPNSAENWENSMRFLCPPFTEAGEQQRHNLPPAKFPESLAERVVVALFVDESISVGSGLQYIEELVAEFAQCPERGFIPVIYCFYTVPPSLREVCRHWSISLIDMDVLRGQAFAVDDIRLRLLALRTHAQAHGVSAIIYFSTMEWLVSLAAAIGLAPVQIYSTLMFHSFMSPYIDGYLALASFNTGIINIDGRDWRTVPISIMNRLPPAGSVDAEEFEQHVLRTRQEILGNRFQIVLASIARPEKMDAALFDIVARRLKAHPEAVFVYFGLGKEPPSHLLEMIHARGIESQCHFAGWVSTLLYAKVVDIHLDPLHLPSGYTMFETFWAGRAYVLKRGMVADRIGMTPYLREIDEARGDDEDLRMAKAIFHCARTDESVMALAKTVEEYEALVERLIVDPVWRSKVAAAAGRFMEVYFGRPGRVTHAFDKHITELIAAKRLALSQQ